MSNDLTKPPENRPTHDFTQEDLQRIEKFKEGGMLGLATVTDADVIRMMDMYLSGKPYREISQILKKDKTTIMYLSQKFDWFAMRRTYIEELGITIRDRVLEKKLQSQEFLLNLSHAFEKKIGRRVNNFLRTDSEEEAQKINLKDIDKYLKIVETLHKLQADTPDFGGRPSAPLVGINPGQGMTIKKVGDDSIEITPGPATKKDMKSRLKQFADMKRNLEKEQLSPETNDIDLEQSEGDDDEINE